MKIAVIHDWLVTYAGAERVLEQILKLYPQADVYSLVDFLPDGQRGFLGGRYVKTSFIQKLPLARKKYRQYLPLMPLAVEQFDLSSYDLVISSSHAVAKGVITGPDQVHVTYVHTPIRYAWDMQHQYLRDAGLTKGIKGAIARMVLHYIRNWDSRTANGVDAFAANSGFIARRIWKTYRREAAVIYPPVNVNLYEMCAEKEDYYVTASRMVPYKRVDLIVEAFSAMPDKKLIVAGDGPEYNRIQAKAGANVIFKGFLPDHELKLLIQKAKAFIFAAEEDFGIAPVEAQACGTPVIAFGKGGALESVRGLEQEHPTGLFFPTQNSQSLAEAIRTFEMGKDRFNPEDCRENALRFSEDRFRSELSDFVNAALSKASSD